LIFSHIGNLKTLGIVPRKIHRDVLQHEVHHGQVYVRIYIKWFTEHCEGLSFLIPLLTGVRIIAMLIIQYYDRNVQSSNPFNRNGFIL